MELKVIETRTYVTPLGVRFRDVISGAAISDGLVVSVTPVTGNGATRVAATNRIGTFIARDLPDLRAAEVGSGDAAFWAAIPGGTRAFIVSVVDARGRYLPGRFTANLPHRGAYALHLDGPALPLLPAGERSVPLFAAPSCPIPGTLGSVRASLVDAGDGRPAAGAVLRLSLGGLLIGLGIADAAGECVLPFRWPEPPLPPAPPLPLSGTGWTFDLAAFYGRVPGPIPDLRALLAQNATTLSHAGNPLSTVAVTFAQPAILGTAADRAIAVAPN